MAAPQEDRGVIASDSVLLPHSLSHAQAAFFIAYAITIFLWLLSEYVTWLCGRRDSQGDSEEAELLQVSVTGGKGGPTGVPPGSAHHHHGSESALGKQGFEEPLLGGSNGLGLGNGASMTNGSNGAKDGAAMLIPASTSNGSLVSTAAGKHTLGSMASGDAVTSGGGIPVGRSASSSSASARHQAGASSGSMWGELMGSAAIRCLMLDRTALRQSRPTLRAMAEFGSLMVWYFICDRTSLLGAATKSYSRDLFLFLFLILTLVAVGASMSTVKAPVLLVRQQTEEWKGWMQVLFLLYHYYEAKEYYNAIRIFIACYVWMTGFGNFIYYHKTGDFSLGRFAQMMWRLNFLVLIACVVLRNSYMLYYICPMHTLFTIMVYACLGIASHLNQSKAWVAIKVVACWLVVQLLWHKPIFYAMWSPFTWMVGYLDPRKPDFTDAMHEWFFRSSLDRYVWIYGMVCGALHPAMQSALYALDALPRLTQAAVRTGLIAACLGVGYLWYVNVYTLPRAQYNQVHPYTSWIPITLWGLLRNLTPTLRLHHLRLYGWLGCITLETYICQFHVWMRTDLPDGQPKALLVLLPDYPLLNFAAVTALYVLISYRLFELTNALKTAWVPHSNNALLLRNVLTMGALGALAYAAGATTLSQLSWA